MGVPALRASGSGGGLLGSHGVGPRDVRPSEILAASDVSPGVSPGVSPRSLLNRCVEPAVVPDPRVGEASQPIPGVHVSTDPRFLGDGVLGGAWPSLPRPPRPPRSQPSSPESKSKEQWLKKRAISSSYSEQLGFV